VVDVLCAGVRSALEVVAVRLPIVRVDELKSFGFGVTLLSAEGNRAVLR